MHVFTAHACTNCTRTHQKEDEYIVENHAHEESITRIVTLRQRDKGRESEPNYE